jgi:hypothetical protein
MARPQFQPRWKDLTGLSPPVLSREQLAWVRWLLSNPERQHKLAMRSQLAFCPNRLQGPCAWVWIAPPHHRYQPLGFDYGEAPYLAGAWLTDEIVTALEAHLPNCPLKEVSS